MHLDKIDSLNSALIALQQAAGNFGSTQTTAYAVMALLKAGENDAAKAAKKGVKYPIHTQSPNGGWTEDSSENTEADSEAIQAIFNFEK